MTEKCLFCPAPSDPDIVTPDGEPICEECNNSLCDYCHARQVDEVRGSVTLCSGCAQDHDDAMRSRGWGSEYV